jgi:hypothetical protein
MTATTKGEPAVVDDDGNVVMPSDQLPTQLTPGTHVQLCLVTGAPVARRSLYGALPSLPELSWEDFERASRLAVADVEDGASNE